MPPLSNFKRFDVRPLLKRKGEPLPEILRRVEALKAGSGLIVIAPFLPSPLIELLGSKGAARINCDISPNIFVRTSTAWQPAGKTDEWKPLDAALAKPSPEHNLGPVGDWLDAIAKEREPEASGRNGAWAVEMVMAVYHAALKKARVPFPLAQRAHALKTS